MSAVRRVLALVVLALPAAVVWADAEADKIARLIKQLGSDSFDEREAATKELRQLGEAALTALREATRSDDAEIRKRAGELAEAVAAGLAGRAVDAFQKLGGRLHRENDDPTSAVVLLGLSDTRVADADLVHLRAFGGLQTLDLARTGVADAGLAHLRGLRRLVKLDLTRTRVAGPGLEQLTGLPLEVLDLTGAPVADAGVVHVGKMAGLKRLHLARTGVTDEGLAHLRGLGELRALDLSDTAVTDAGLEALKGLTRLEKLSLVRTRTTEKGVEALRKAMPHTTILR
jgi:hypothetical protein